MKEEKFEFFLYLLGFLRIFLPIDDEGGHHQHFPGHQHFRRAMAKAIMSPHLHHSVCSDASCPLWRCCGVGRCPHPRKWVKEKQGLSAEPAGLQFGAEICGQCPASRCFPADCNGVFVYLLLKPLCETAALSPVLKAMNLTCVWAQKVQEYGTVEHLASEFSIRNNSLASNLMGWCTCAAKR